MNLETAKSIGILFHHTDNDSFRTIQKFLKQFAEQKKQVYAVGYVEAMEIPEFYVLKRGFNFFCLKDLNWYFKPEPDFVLDFADREFDMMINLSLDDYFPVEYLYATSRAKFKISRYIEDQDYSDLYIDIKDNRDIDYLIQQIIHYLNLINKKQ